MVAILGMASNRGRNLLNIHRERPGGAQLGVVLTNDASAPVLDGAAEYGVPTEVVEREAGEDRFSHEERILDAVADYDIDVVCLDGHMRILSSVFLDAMPITLNVHPSLLPAFPGADAWDEALHAGVAVSGCTVHVVTNAVADDGSIIESKIDGGPIVTQEPVPVYDDDTTATLKDRILYDGEFLAYPRAVRWVAEDAITVTENEEGPVSVTVPDDQHETFPTRRLDSHDRRSVLRYGENPHQEAALYASADVTEPSVVGAEQVSGDKGMSYVNYVDAAGALDLITEFERPAAAVIKHANPAGCATDEELVGSYDRALSTDPMSAFGGVVALNRPCDPATAERIVDSVKHVVVAPGFTGDALSILGDRESMRVLDVSDGSPGPIGPDDRIQPLAEKQLVGGRLVQERDLARIDPADLEVVTDREPSDDERHTMAFAWPVVKHATSNAIVMATGTETVGLGIGQVSRVDAVRIAGIKAEEHAEGKGPGGAVMASDAFFPFPDGIERAAAAGVEAVIQPGGSIRDDEVIDVANDHDLAMVFTGQRCFLH